MSTPKIVLVVVWLVAIGGFFIAPASTISGLARILFWFLAVAHAIECGVFLPKLRAAGGSLGQHLVQTFFFGIVHVKELEAAAEKANS
jgi:uncharacterized protein YhhL (DUF1145 family)